MAVTKKETKASRLIINKLTKAQYDAAKAAGQISDTELYMVTDDTVYATVEQLNTLAENVLYFSVI